MRNLELPAPRSLGVEAMRARGGARPRPRRHDPKVETKLAAWVAPIATKDKCLRHGGASGLLLQRFRYQQAMTRLDPVGRFPSRDPINILPSMVGCSHGGQMACGRARRAKGLERPA